MGLAPLNLNAQLSEVGFEEKPKCHHGTTGTPPQRTNFCDGNECHGTDGAGSTFAACG